LIRDPPSFEEELFHAKGAKQKEEREGGEAVTACASLARAQRKSRLRQCRTGLGLGFASLRIFTGSA